MTPVLPEEIWVNIFSYLAPPRLALTFLVNRQWRRIASDSQVRRVYFQRKFRFTPSAEVIDDLATASTLERLLESCQENDLQLDDLMFWNIDMCGPVTREVLRFVVQQLPRDKRRDIVYRDCYDTALPAFGMAISFGMAAIIPELIQAGAGPPDGEIMTLQELPLNTIFSPDVLAQLYHGGIKIHPSVITMEIEQHLRMLSTHPWGPLDEVDHLDRNWRATILSLIPFYPSSVLSVDFNLLCCSGIPEIVRPCILANPALARSRSAIEIAVRSSCLEVVQLFTILPAEVPNLLDQARLSPRPCPELITYLAHIC